MPSPGSLLSLLHMRGTECFDPVCVAAIASATEVACAMRRSWLVARGVGRIERRGTERAGELADLGRDRRDLLSWTPSGKLDATGDDALAEHFLAAAHLGKQRYRIERPIRLTQPSLYRLRPVAMSVMVMDERARHARAAVRHHVDLAEARKRIAPDH